MDTGVATILGTGALAILAGGTALTLIVRRDLAPARALNRARTRAGGKGSSVERWILGGALGVGIIAFTFKMAVTWTVASFPERTITPLLPESGQTTWADDPTPTHVRAFTWSPLPLGAPHPPDNPTTPEKVALGKRLFNDQRLSRDGDLSCASCHALVERAGADGRSVALGAEAQEGTRNTPTVWNAAFQGHLFWDGRATSLEEQALGPLVNPIEMAMPSLEAVVARVSDDPSYAPAFAQAFGEDDGITAQRIAQAIATYERTLITPHTRYDRFLRGETTLLSEREKRGMWLFEKAGCVQCHAGPNFSGASTIGLRRPFAPLRVGDSAIARRYDLTSDRGRNGLWRVPSLRNVALTGPYLHNGSIHDLEEVIRVMAEYQLGLPLTGTHPAAAPRWLPEQGRFASDRPRGLSDVDIKDIAAFLGTLSDPRLETR